MRNRTRQPVLFEDTFNKPVHVAFDAEALSSDGGAMLLAQLDQGIGLTRTLIDLLDDTRQPGKIAFTFDELIRQRTYSIALGYEDGIDANTLAGDPMMKLAAGRDPKSDPDLASQSTISRFENAPSGRQIVEMGRRLETFVIERLARRHRKARVITLDFDSTVDPVHGEQQLSLFNGFYDMHCYLPLLGFISIDDEPEQHLFRGTGVSSCLGWKGAGGEQVVWAAIDDRRGSRSRVLSVRFSSGSSSLAERRCSGGMAAPGFGVSRERQRSLRRRSCGGHGR